MYNQYQLQLFCAHKNKKASLLQRLGTDVRKKTVNSVTNDFAKIEEKTLMYRYNYIHFSFMNTIGPEARPKGWPPLAPIINILIIIYNNINY